MRFVIVFLNEYEWMNDFIKEKFVTSDEVACC